MTPDGKDRPFRQRRQRRETLPVTAPHTPQRAIPCAWGLRGLTNENASSNNARDCIVNAFWWYRAGVDDEGRFPRVARLRVLVQPPRAAPAGQAPGERRGLPLCLQRGALVARPGECSYHNLRQPQPESARPDAASVPNTLGLFCRWSHKEVWFFSATQ